MAGSPINDARSLNTDLNIKVVRDCNNDQIEKKKVKNKKKNLLTKKKAFLQARQIPKGN